MRGCRGFFERNNKNAGVAQLVERNLAKVDVAGSSPVSRSKIPISRDFYFGIYKIFYCLSHIGAVPKWLKGKVCKTFIRRFESDRRLKHSKKFQMYYVYILKSMKDNKRYFGYTENIEHRLSEHNAGLVKSTRNRRPLRIIHIEEFESKKEALMREKELKKKKGKDSFRILN